MTAENVLVFGATGAIGTSIIQRFSSQGCHVFAVSRKGPIEKTSDSGIEWFVLNGLLNNSDHFFPEETPQMDAVVWSQGANCSDDIYDLDIRQHEALYFSNVSYILVTLQSLLRHKRLKPRARLCVISSIWQNIARQKKLSYCITKSALQGLVQSLAVDLGGSGYLINAVLPGALDTPMTRANLSDQQIHALESMTPLGNLPTLDEVSSLVLFLCSRENTGITGQFIAVDKGFSYARII